ncbi:SGNH/GDSL hydrolase family protein [Leifsonia poae]|uniref:SGNH/GDSL hydrolase family protein n=1 Tax=Leifsonia poae TaxID=110933 RepID=UPI001CC1AA8B|nr:SGNH/GDSL hydrolase family protein [Leifsonia poae]
MRRRTIVIPIIAVVAVGALAGAGAIAWAANSGRPAEQRSVATAEATPTPTPTLDPFPRRPLTSETRYVALGDSFAAGMGGGDEQGRCVMSDNSYPHEFATAAGIDLVADAACSGATTSDLLKHQLSALDDDTDLVTVSIGGNDLGVAEIASDCAAGKSVPCRTELTSALSLLNVLPDRLDLLYAAIAKAAPHARIVVTGYATLYEVTDPAAKDFGTATAINVATIGLNQVIRQAVDKQRANGVPITFVNVDFDGHGIGSAHPWINTSGPTAFHPTAAGYREYARELQRLLGVAG